MKRIILVTFVTLFTFAGGRNSSAVNTCIEYGPHANPWTCVSSAQFTNTGALAPTNINVCIHQTIDPAVLVSNVGFVMGKKQQLIWFDCDEPSYYLTNKVFYQPTSFFFDPPIPGFYTNSGTFNHTGKVTLVTSTLMGWWAAESNTVDRAFGNNGTLGGNATYGAGRVGTAFVLDGNSDGVTLTNVTDLQLQDFAIEAWIKRASTTKATQDPGQPAGLFLSYGYNGYGFGMWDNGNLILSKIGINNVTVSTGINNTNWHHVAVSKNGSNVVFYVDGTNYSASPYNPGFRFQTAAAIGGRGDGLGLSFYGSIDEVAIYSCPLSASEITNIYSAGSTGKCWTGGPGGCATLPPGCVCSSVTTNVGVVTIVVTGAPPVILTQPTNQTVLVGADVNFSVGAAGCPTLSYQWRFNGTNVAGATNSTLSLLNIQIGDGGDYSAVVTDASDSVTSSNATLTVLSAPSITQQPQNQTVLQGSNVTFSVSATGVAPLYYQWRFNGANIAGATTTLLALTNVQWTNAGGYTVVITNGSGSITSVTASLTVLTGPDLPGAAPNFELIPAGSLVIPMDTNYQAVVSPFNLKAYGLVNALLHTNIPVKWAIAAAKAKDGIDFAASARRILPTTLNASNLSFRSGPFIIHRDLTNQALPVITAYSNNVAVYQITNDVSVDVRYTLAHKPQVAVLDDGNTQGVQTNILKEAGFPTNHYRVLHAVDVHFLSVTSCFTIVTSPHFDGGTTATNQTDSIRQFILDGGNFLAQCAAVRTYENNTLYGRFHSTLGFVDDNSATSFTYPNPDMAFSQFQGALANEGGSLQDWKLGTSSVLTNHAYPQVLKAGTTNIFRAGVAKLIKGKPGSVVFYLGGHSYDGNGITEINGRRLYLNALFVPPDRPADCVINFQTDLGISKDDSVVTVTNGQQLTYQIVVTNSGPGRVVGAPVTDIFPPALTNVSWTWTGAGGGTCAVASATGNINTNVDLPIHASVTFTVQATVNTAVSCTISNVASITVPSGLTDPNPANNQAIDLDQCVVAFACPTSLTVQCTNDVPAVATNAAQFAAQGGTVPGTSCGNPTVLTHLGDSTNGGSGCAASPLIITRSYRSITGCGSTNDCSQTIIVSNSTPTTADAPVSQTNNPGTTVTFTTAGLGACPVGYRYQWLKNDVVLAGRTNSSLTLSNLTVADAGVYSVEVMGACNSVTKSATLTIYNPLTVSITQPTNNAVFVAPAVIPISATVSNADGLQRVEFFPNPNAAPIGQDTLSTGNPYTFTWVGVPANGSNYTLTAKATDDFGSATSTGVVVHVVPPVGVDPGPNRIVVLTNGSAMITLYGGVTGGVAGGATSRWSQVTGPTPASGLSSTNLNTAVAFNQSGNYLLLLEAGDGHSWDSGVISITVLSNQAPVVEAGPNRIIAPSNTVFLNGSASDDGLPLPVSLSNWWVVVSQPAGANVGFTNGSLPITAGTNFIIQGVYTNRLYSTDGLATNFSDMTVTVAEPSSRTYTFSADFAEGALINVNFDDVPDQLQLNQTITPFPFVWVACSARGTVVRLDANTGQILGEYRTSPQTVVGDRYDDEKGPNPSRTTVDKHGNVWVANRADNVATTTNANSKGSISRIALVVGGTRGWIQTNATGGVTNFVADQRGEYLQPPFQYCTAVDRNHDGYIRTSSGLGNILDWDSPQTGTDDFGGVSAAEDECIINYTRVDGTGVRTIAVDANNDVWIGGYDSYSAYDRTHQKISGVTGQIIPNTRFDPSTNGTSSGGYGGLIDGNGVLWSARRLVRFDISRWFDMTVSPPTVIDANYIGDAIVMDPADDYGLSIDPNTGNIWASISGDGNVVKVSPDGASVVTYTNEPDKQAQGIAVDDHGNVWEAGGRHNAANNNNVSHFRTDGTLVGNIDLGCTTNADGVHGPTGVAVDSNGKVWVVNYNSSTAMRIDPNRGPRMLYGKLHPGGYLLGEVDLTVYLNTPEQNLDKGDLPLENQKARPYNYSDMTGFVSVGATEPSGVWNVVHDSGVSNQAWGVVKWAENKPAGTDIKIEVRAATNYLELTATTNLFLEVTNNIAFDSMFGRYLEIRATLSHKLGTNATPVLSDLTVSSGTNAVIANAANLAQDDRAAMFENGNPIVINVLSNDIAPAGTNLVITRVSAASSGFVAIGTGATNLTYTPNTNFHGADRFVYTATDGQGSIGRGVVTVLVGHVTPLPPAGLYGPPVATDIDTNINGNTTLTFGVDDIFSDTNSTPLLPVTISFATQPGHGYVGFTSCKMSYTPDAGYSGPDSFTCTARNTQGLSATARITVFVMPRTPIACGTNVTRYISTSNNPVWIDRPDWRVQVYTFDASPMQTNTLGLDADAYDAGVRIFLINSKGVEVDSSDASGNPIHYGTSFADSYTVYVGKYTYGSDTNYTLSFSCVTPSIPHMGVWLGPTALPVGSGIDFSVTQVGHPVPAYLTITNYGTASLTVSNLDYDLGGGNYTLADTTLTNHSILITAGGSSNLTVWYEALQPGQTNGVLALYGDDPWLEFTNPYVINLTGRANPANTVRPTTYLTNLAPNSFFNYTNSTCSGTGTGTVVQISAYAAAAPGIAIRNVDFYARLLTGTNTFLAGPLYPSGGGIYTNEWFNMPPGSYQLTAVAVDQYGLQTVSDPVPITVSPALNVLFFGTNDLPDGSTINFGLVPTNVPRYVTLVLTNLSLSTLTISDFSYYQPFSLTNSPTGTIVLESHESTNLTVVFQSASACSGGDCSGYLDIVNDGDCSGQRVINLTGSATNSGASLSVAITSPASNAVFLSPSSISLEAEATASGGGTINSVSFYATSSAGSVFIGSSYSGNPYSRTWFDPVPGEYLITAVVMDSEGRATVSDPVSVTIQTHPTNSPAMSVFLFQTNALPNRSTIDFGLTTVGVPSPISLTISNWGDADLSISKLILSNTNEFTMDRSPIVLSPNSSTNLSLEYQANAPGAAICLLTIYDNDTTAHPFYLTNTAYANPVNNTNLPTVQLTTPTDGSRLTFPADITVSAIAACASNSTLWGINFFASTGSGPVQIGQVLAGPGQTNLIGTITWPRPAPGVYTLKAIALDRSGLIGVSTNRVVEVIDSFAGSTNRPPNGPPIAREDYLWLVGCDDYCGTRRIDVLANDSDPNNDPLTLTGFQYEGGLGSVIQEGNHLVFTLHPRIEGTNWISYTVTDGRGGYDTGWVQIRVTRSPLPVVELLVPADNERFFGEPTDLTNRFIMLRAHAYSPSTNLSIARVSFYDNPDTGFLGGSGQEGGGSSIELIDDRRLLGSTTITNGEPDIYTFKWVTPPAGTHRITAYVQDSVGQENLSGAYIDGQVITSHGAVIYVAGNSNNIPPVAAITNLLAVESNGALVYPMVTNGIVDVLGLAQDLDTGDSVSYQIHLTRPDGTFVADLTPRTGTTNGFHVGTDIDGVLATNVDLSLYENGAYDIVLNVFDGWEISSHAARILLNTQLKIGQFSFSVQDMVLPVAGMPLTVTRTYNSFNLDKGDFGYSWTYAINDVNLEIDEIRERTAEIDTEENFSLRVGGGHDVTLTLPDGRRTTFQFYFGDAVDCGDFGGYGQYCYPALWRAPPGVNYTLTSLAGTNYYNGLTRYWDDSAGTGFENYDLPGFILKAPDGTQYVISRDDEEDHFFFSGYNDDYYAHTYGKARLTEIIQPDHTRIVLGPDSINHLDVSNHVTRSIYLERKDGRIVAIRDPVSGTNGLPVVNYKYDETSGNLTEVGKLVDRTAGRYEYTTYEYTNTHFLHYLTGIIDPRGVTVAKNYYYDDGRLWKVVDADGKVTEFQHNTTNRVEIITDRMGNTSSYAYDLRGNVTASTNAGVVALMKYDDRNQLLAQTNAFGTDQMTWSLYAYDEKGNQTNVVTSPNHTNSFTYDQDNGNLLTHVDPLGNVTTNGYDELGNLTNTVQLDSNNVVVARSSSTYLNGHLVETRDGSNNVTASFGYDSKGNLTSTTDAKEVTRTFGYDANGNQTSSSYDCVNNGVTNTVTTTTVYDAAGRVTMSIDALGNTNRTFYNTSGKPDYSVDTLGNTNSFLYDARGNLIQTIYPNGTFTHTVYDENARPFLTTDRNGITGTRTYYDTAGRATNVVRLANVRIDIEGDTNNPGQKRSVIGAAGTGLSTNVTEYFASGWVKSRTGTDGKMTTYAYWPDGQLMYVTNALQETTLYSYDVAGRQEYIADALNHTNRFEYDAVGRMIKTIYHDGTFTTNLFNLLGQRVGVKDQAGRLTQFDYDVSGQLTNVTKPQVLDPENGTTNSPVWSYQYDQYGRQTVTTDPKTQRTTNSYDQFGRPVSRWLPLGGQGETNHYNARGQLDVHYDFKGQKTEFVYDRFGRTRAKFYFEAGAAYPSNGVCYVYNQLGQLSKIIERSGVGVTTNSCDGYAALFGLPGDGGGGLLASLGRIPKDVAGGGLALPLLAAMVMLLPRSRRREFVACLRAAWQAQQELELKPVKRLRLPSYGWRFATVVTVTALMGCDPAFDRLWTANAACNIPSNASIETERITEFSYDLEGRLAQVNSPEGVINYGYDLATGRHTSTCTANSEIQYGYDDLGRLQTVHAVTRNGLPVDETTTYTYTKVGSREKVSLPNGVETTYQYDALNRLTNLVNSMGGTNLLSQFSYQVDATGRRTNAVEIIKTEDTTPTYQTNTLSWAYDGLYRLTNEVCITTVSGGSYTNAFQYDRAGNRWQKMRVTASSTTTITNQYNANDQLLEEVTLVGGTPTQTNTYAYDANGSLVARTNLSSSSSTALYSYNLKNKLSSVAVYNGSWTTNQFQYNDAGIRVRTVTSESTRYFLVDANNQTGYAQVLEESTTLGGTPTMSYVLGDDVLAQATSTASYLLYDGHGSTRQLANTSGGVSSRYNFDAYGTTLDTSTSSPETSLLYCGEQYDSTLGMYNLRARYYDPANGRFNARDTFRGNNDDPQSLHKYAYCHGDPVNALDPSGNISLIEQMVVWTCITIIALELVANYAVFTRRTRSSPGNTYVGDILNEYFSSTSRERLWVMGPNDRYTRIVTGWQAVRRVIGAAKDDFRANSGIWQARHRSTPNWAPGMNLNGDPNAWGDTPGRNGILVRSPDGTDYITAGAYFALWRTLGVQTDALHIAAIGSFWLFITADSIDVSQNRATLRIWMANRMYPGSFSSFAPPALLLGAAQANQWMWWNWTEESSW